MSTPEPGWYPDPERPGSRRYWNGSEWTQTEAEYESSKPQPTEFVPVTVSGGGQVHRGPYWRKQAWLVLGAIGVTSVIFWSIRIANQESGVDWDNYAPIVKTRIDEAIATGDCVRLAQEIIKAGANNAAQLNRTGEDNSDLITYIGEGAKSAGCR